jgi:hypothetical protein
MKAQDVHFFLLRFGPDVKLSVICFFKHSNLLKNSLGLANPCSEGSFIEILFTTDIDLSTFLNCSN